MVTFKYKGISVMKKSAVLAVACAVFLNATYAEAVQYKLLHAKVEGNIIGAASVSAKALAPQKGIIYDYVQSSTKTYNNGKSTTTEAIEFERNINDTLPIEQNSNTHIISFQVKNISTHSAEINFITDKPVTSYIEHAVISAETLARENVSTLERKVHVIELSNLYPGVEYRVFANATQNNKTVLASKEIVFKTLSESTKKVTEIETSKKSAAATFYALSSISNKKDTTELQQIPVIEKKVDKNVTPLQESESYEEHRKKRLADGAEYLFGAALDKTKAVEVVNIVTLTKSFDANVFAELYPHLSFEQKESVQKIEPALFTYKNILNVGVFNNLENTKRALLLDVLDGVPTITVANDMLNIQTKLDASIPYSTKAQWSAYADSKLLMVIDDMYFIKPVKNIILRVGRDEYEAIYMSDGTWRAQMTIPHTDDLYSLDVYVEYEDDTFDLHKTQLKVGVFAEVIGKTERQDASAVNGMNQEYTRLGSTKVSLYKEVYSTKVHKKVWQLYTPKFKNKSTYIGAETITLNPQITNQNGEMALILPKGRYRAVVETDQYESVVDKVINHPGGIFSASVIVSEKSATILSFEVIVYLIVGLVFLFAILLGFIYRKFKHLKKETEQQAKKKQKALKRKKSRLARKYKKKGKKQSKKQ